MVTDLHHSNDLLVIKLCWSPITTHSSELGVLGQMQDGGSQGPGLQNTDARCRLLFPDLFCLLPERMFWGGKAQVLLITLTMSLSSRSSVSVSHYSVTVSQPAHYQDTSNSAVVKVVLVFLGFFFPCCHMSDRPQRRISQTAIPSLSLSVLDIRLPNTTCHY